MAGFFFRCRIKNPDHAAALWNLGAQFLNSPNAYLLDKAHFTRLAPGNELFTSLGGLSLRCIG